VLGILPESEGTGYPLSLEGGGSDLAALRTLYPHGRETFLGDPLRQVVQYGLELINDPFDFYAASHVIDGVVDLQGSVLGLQTSSPVWYTAAVMIDDHYDVLRFDLDFTSDAGAEGLLAVYLDDVLLGTIDERFSPDEPFENVFAAQLLSPGFHLLSFRLDPFTEVASVAAISNLRWGSLVVILPGDYNGDGAVNAADYTVWRNTLGSTTDLRADGNRDRIIGREDYEIWKAYYGEVLTAEVSDQHSVPEPSTIMLSVLWLLMFNCRYCFRRLSRYESRQRAT
jgi:hypothetical protein